MSWRKGARRPVARQQKAAVTRIAAATRQSANHYAIKHEVLTTIRSRRATGPSANRSSGVFVGAEGRTSVRGRAKKHGHFSSACRRAGEQRGRQDSNLRGDPNGFLVHRLNHSATTTGTCVLCPVLVQHWRLALAPSQLSHPAETAS
ncbi:hypothetical protein G5714_024559 [Onychostoma macrolepis]|uniref:Uncharacterized protein n=1 Tax=Onychostoma macrolepis TaxID=369639 RepID=A0A7J6BHB9_9TELE|nr:hypothetical protein G5714_024559 [Onychostoma macrolepis]